MKDKVKGLIVGLTIGSVLSGSMAFAENSTQIEVAFRNLTYMFDGVEKTPAPEQGKGFIYEGTTYVPLRFVGDALGKKVGWDDTTSTIYIGNNPNQIVATYQGGTVTRGDFDAFFNLQGLFNSSNHTASKDDVTYQTGVLKQLIQNRILYSRASEADIARAKQDAVQQVAQWKQAMGDAKFQNDLKSVNSSESAIQYYLVGTFTAGNVLASSVTDAQLSAKYDEMRKADPSAFVTASVRHILIGLTDDQGKALRTKEEALALAKEVKTKLTNGGDWKALAKQYSDDPGSKENGGLYENAEVGQWVEEFKNAAVEQTVGAVGDPVETQFGYHVIKVESRKVAPLGDVKEQLRGTLQQTQLQQFTDKELPGLIEKIDLGE